MFVSHQKGKLFLILLVLCFFSAQSFLLAHAQNNPSAHDPFAGTDIESPVTDFGTQVMGEGGLLVNIVQWTYTIFFIVAVFFFLLAAYNYMTGGGSEDKIKKAHQQVKYGIIAVIIALLASGSVFFIKDTLSELTI